jgi:hypothetical protein
MLGEGTLPVTLDRARNEKDSLQVHFRHSCFWVLEWMTFHEDVSFALRRFRACRRPLGKFRTRVGFIAKSADTWT